MLELPGADSSVPEDVPCVHAATSADGLRGFVGLRISATVRWSAPPGKRAPARGEDDRQFVKPPGWRTDQRATAIVDAMHGSRSTSRRAVTPPVRCVRRKDADRHVEATSWWRLWTCRVPACPYPAVVDIRFRDALRTSGPRPQALRLGRRLEHMGRSAEREVPERRC